LISANLKGVVGEVASSRVVAMGTLVDGGEGRWLASVAVELGLKQLASFVPQTNVFLMMGRRRGGSKAKGGRWRRDER
jgi:hypothetical protein